VVTQAHDTAAQQQVATALEAALKGAGYKLIGVNTGNVAQERLLTALSAILQMLGALAGLFTVVGGLGLLPGHQSDQHAVHLHLPAVGAAGVAWAGAAHLGHRQPAPARSATLISVREALVYE